VLAGVGASRLGWVGRRRALGMPLLVGAAFVETLVWYEATPVGPRAVDVWLAQADRQILAEFPLSVALSGPGLYYTSHHGKPVVFGYGTHIPREFRATMPALRRFPDRDALDVLREKEVGWVVVTPRAYGTDWPAIAGRIESSAELRLAADLDGVRVYELRRTPLPPDG
jgi:hypothetical protein